MVLLLMVLFWWRWTCVVLVCCGGVWWGSWCWRCTGDGGALFSASFCPPPPSSPQRTAQQHISTNIASTQHTAAISSVGSSAHRLEVVVERVHVLVGRRERGYEAARRERRPLGFGVLLMMGKGVHEGPVKRRVCCCCGAWRSRGCGANRWAAGPPLRASLVRAAAHRGGPAVC